jgi:hypothetical protein
MNKRKKKNKIFASEKEKEVVYEGGHLYIVPFLKNPKGHPI